MARVLIEGLGLGFFFISTCLCKLYKSLGLLTFGHEGVHQQFE